MSSPKNYLQINGGFSLLSSLVMLLLSGFLANVFALESRIAFLVIGAGLLFFGGFVFYVAQKQPGNKTLIQVITIMDAFWVLGSLIIVVFQLFNLSSTGYLLITAVMVIIAFFAINQYRYNKI